MPDSLERRITEFSSQIQDLPDPQELPKTTLHILRSGQQEKAWQRLLFYFLTPGESHGLETALLEHFLSSFSEHYNFDLPFSYFDIENIRVETEVTLSNSGRTDAVIWLPDSWFICWELKIYSPEDGEQTKTYVDAESFESISPDKSSFNRHQYIYLAPESASPPSSNEFELVTWQWIASEIQSFLQEGYGQYPAQTTAQLNDFAATINRELTMTKYQEHEREKSQLYFEYYDEITEAKQAFENRWSEFVDNWGLELARELKECEIAEMPDLSDSLVVVNCGVSDDEQERWIFNQGNSEWAGIMKYGWRRDKVEFSKLYQSKEGREDIQFRLYHRPDLNRELAIQDHTLELQLWHGAGYDDEYMDIFQEKLRSKTGEVNSMPPSSVSIEGSRGNPLTATYDIPVGEYKDFFDAYITALDKAFRDLVIDNREFIRILDESYEEALEVFG